MTDEERQRIVREIRERASEAAAAHSVSDDESELALLEVQLDDEHQALKRLEHEDPVGAIWFGDRDDWVDARLHRKDPRN